MFVDLWHDFLYQPLFNGLILLYNTWADENLGWAIVYLTILLRFAILPLTIASEFTKKRNEELWEEVKRIDKEFHKDPVLKKQEIRRAIRIKKVSPWAAAVSVAIQGLVLVLLYQVFLRGVTGEKIAKILYPSIDFPGIINSFFYGFDLAQSHGILLPGLIALWLFTEIYLDYRKRRMELQKSDLFYFLLFPGAVFLFLWWLPMVKSLFILTSMLISLFLHILFLPFLHVKKKAA